MSFGRNYKDCNNFVINLINNAIWMNGLSPDRIRLFYIFPYIFRVDIRDHMTLLWGPGSHRDQNQYSGMLFLKKSYFSEKILAPSTRGISPRNLNLMYLMKIVPIVIGINNLYTHFVFITHPEYSGPVIPDKNRPEYSGKNTLQELSKITHQNSMPFMPTPNMYTFLCQDIR